MDERKRIAFLCQPYHRGGVTHWMANAAMEYVKIGYDVYFMTLEPEQTFYSGVGRETMLELLSKTDTGIHIIKKRVGRSFEFGTHDYCTFIYKQLFLKVPIGTPVILSDDSMVWGAANSLSGSYPCIGVLHSDHSDYYDLAVKYKNEISILACVSERINKKISEKLGAACLNKIYTIPCGINLPSPNNSDPRKQGVLQLIYIGRLTNLAKRPGDLVKISRLLVDKGIDFYLTIIGDGEEKNNLEKKFAEERLSKYVKFCGWLSSSDIHTYLNESDILLLTSDFEGLPIVMMEALAAGCGFVGTRVSGVEDYENVAHAQECYMVYNVGDIEDAVNKITYISPIPEGVRKNAARAIAEANFSLLVCVEKYNKAIASLSLQSYINPGISLPASKRFYSQAVSFVRHIKLKFF